MRINKETDRMTAEYSKIKITYMLNNNIVLAALGDVIFICKRYGDVRKAESKFYELAAILEAYEGYALHYIKEQLKSVMK